MEHDSLLTPAGPDEPRGHVPTDSLTQAQREFARLLGRILAERWDRERPSPARPATAPPA